MVSKKDEFLQILRKYGITEYWCDPFFHPEREHPVASIVFPVNNPHLSEEVDNLYNDYSSDDTSTLAIYHASKGTNAFRIYSKGKEKRLVQC